ncbi:hypothetical protein P691DRAFT_131435 [Macrolepiota fuliginosa MF-IS2]|uniref:Centrosomin N-terminal motif 1 domain-containing protein n=1 Tax=Macrolepiota fuliginosa MF-IS2 TaxID=1400762 RepID=A0A9P5XBI5_9AGAR|nr:hypothetical protein P691DRAFT_131435 [Macrolepiota fuliginosa MF-IS2]
MSAALASHPDLSSASNGTHPEISLGSLASGFSTPGRHLRIPSISSRSTAQSSAPIATPSPPTVSSVLSRRKVDGGLGFSSRLGSLSRDDRDGDDGDDGVGGDLLDTPAVDKKRYGEDAETPMRGGKRGARASAAGTKGVTLTLRDQEKHIDNLKKENFNIKLRVHFLEERLAQLAPDQIDAALKQNINLKIEVQQRNMELKKHKKLVLQLERELEQQQNQQRTTSGSRDRERELEEKLEEREREIRELRRLRASQGNENDDVMRELEMQNAQLEEELESARELLQDNMDEIERLKDHVERREDSLSESSAGEGNRTRMLRRIGDLEEENDELRHRLGDQEEVIAQREDDKEELIDIIDSLKLEIEDLHRRRDVENVERSQSRALILEEREEREAVEDDLNAMRDRVAALLIELQQKEDDVDQKSKEIDELVAEHKRIVEVVEDEWRGEVEEARMQAEELKDVLAERETEVRELRFNVSEFEGRNNDLRHDFETALNDLEVQAEAKDAEIEGLRTTIDKLGEDIYILEDENDKIKEEAERLRDDDVAERERLEALSAALKEVCFHIPSTNSD